MASYDLKGTDLVLVNIQEFDNGSLKAAYKTHQVKLDDISEMVLESMPSIGTTLTYVQNAFSGDADDEISAKLNSGEFTSNIIAGGFPYEVVDTFIFSADADISYLENGEELVFRNITQGNSAVYKVTGKTNQVVSVDFVSRTSKADNDEISDKDACTIEIRREVYPLNTIQSGDVKLMEKVNLDLDGLAVLPN